MTGDLPADFGRLPPRIVTEPPGPASRALSERLHAVESRNVTYRGPDFPVFWEEARGANVRDADGNVYLDLTAAFGVALAGHAPGPVRDAVAAQAQALVHGMGDVHPPGEKVRFLEALTRLLDGVRVGADREPESGPAGPDPEATDGEGEDSGAPFLPDPRTVLANSGSEAVEIALKTAHLATGRPGVVAFRGGYHGLTLGALSATARPYFRAPFRDRLPSGVAWADFPVTPAAVPGVLERVEGWLRKGLPDGTPVGAVIVEPVQARGGVRIPAPGFGEALSRLVRKAGTVLVADEIYTGLGRCGAVLASPLVGLRPEVVCLGKILGGGLPLSACVGTRSVMDAWPDSPGEALHTSTFLGHPLACAAGRAMLALVEAGLPGYSREYGERLLAGLQERLAEVPGVKDVRGLGLLIGIEVREGAAVTAAERLLKRGVLVLPAGDRGQVLELSPPAVLTSTQEAVALDEVAAVIEAMSPEAGGA